MTVVAVTPAVTRTRRRLFPERRLLFVASPFRSDDSSQLATAFLEDTLAAARLAQVTPVLISAPPLNGSEPITVAPSFAEAIRRFSPTAVCAIRGDVPHLPAAFLADAFGRLAHPDTDLVLGPLEKEGHYLIGAKSTTIELLPDISWGGPEFFSAVPEWAHALSLRMASLPPWYPLETIADLDRLQRHLQEGTIIAPGTAAVLELYRQYIEQIPGTVPEP